MDTRTYGAYGYRVAATVDVAHTGYASEVVEIRLGWYLLGRRFFIPWLRRFISPDPVSPIGAGGLNRYAYCSCDPINRIDPSGHASFGWLGKLLGQLADALGNATNAVSRLTPTAALGAVSRTAEILGVSVGIGAVAAAALDDPETAGILGWIAVGSLIGTGLGAAGHFLGKPKSVQRAGLATAGKSYGLRKRMRLKQKDGYEKGVYRSPDGKRTITYYKGAGAVEKYIPERAIRSRTGEITGIEANWQVYTSPNGGKNYVLDMKNDRGETWGAYHLIASDPQAWDIDLMSGVHGKPHGENYERKHFWSKEKIRKYGDPLILSDADHLAEAAENLVQRQSTVTDLAGRSMEDIMNLSNREMHIVHMACYSAASLDLMELCNVKSIKLYDL